MLAFPRTSNDRPTGPASSLGKRMSAKPWGHDCREHRSWRCVWCESLFCFECDTGTTAFIDKFPYHRLCQTHLAQLPGGNTASSIESGLSTPSSVGLAYLSNNHSSTDLSGDTKCPEKDFCNCLLSKTMLCSDCVGDARVWQGEQAKIYDRTGVIECAYGRFPGGCKAEIGARCGCGGRGLSCNFINDKDWEKFEKTDLLWIGRTGLADDQFTKKEKKDLRVMFGENFPARGHGDSFEFKYRPATIGAITPPSTPNKKQLWAGLSGSLRRSKSIQLISNPKKSVASLCDSACAGSMSSSERNSQPANPPLKTFLTNPQMRKPYSNFRVSVDLMRPPPPMRRLEDAFLDSDSDEYDSEPEIDPVVANDVEDEHSIHEPDDHESDYASIADSISTLGSEYDFEEASDSKDVYPNGLHPAPVSSVHVGTASLATRQLSPRLITMRSSPNLKTDISPGTSSSLVKDRKLNDKDKWGCCNEVDLSKVDLRTIQSHGFWRCSFCSGRIRGV